MTNIFNKGNTVCFLFFGSFFFGSFFFPDPSSQQLIHLSSLLIGSLLARHNDILIIHVKLFYNYHHKL